MSLINIIKISKITETINNIIIINTGRIET